MMPMKLGANFSVGIDLGFGHASSSVVLAERLADGTLKIVAAETFGAEVDNIRWRHDDQLDALTYAFLAHVEAHELQPVSLKRRAREQRRLDWESNSRRRKRRMELARLTQAKSSLT